MPFYFTKETTVFFVQTFSFLRSWAYKPWNRGEEGLEPCYFNKLAYQESLQDVLLTTTAHIAIKSFVFIITDKAKLVGEGVKGVGVVKDEEIKLEEIASHTLGG
jgi:hypothetical protein